MSDDTSNNTINFNDDVSSFGTFVYYYAPGPTLTDTEMEHYIDNFNDSFIMGLNTNNVTSLSQVFSDNMNFNLNIGAWDVGSVINMFAMFHGASSFNQDISGWNVSSVTNMRSMFFNATSFNQDISGWNVSNCRDFNFMFDNTALIQQGGLLYGKTDQINQLYSHRTGGHLAQERWNALWTQ